MYHAPVARIALVQRMIHPRITPELTVLTCRGDISNMQRNQVIRHLGARGRRGVKLRHVAESLSFTPRRAASATDRARVSSRTPQQCVPQTSKVESDGQNIGQLDERHDLNC